MKNLTILFQRGFANAMMLGLATSTTGIAIVSTPANAANLSYIGNLATPNDAPSFAFTADGTSTVTIQSYSWGGGTNVEGTTIAPGGFDLALSLFDGAGNWKDEREDIGFNNLDFTFTGILPAGTYQAVITAFGNSPIGSFPGGKLSDGFTNTGDFSGLTSAYAFDIINVNNASVPPTSTAVPEPSDLIGTVVAGFSVVLFKRRLGSKKK